MSDLFKCKKPGTKCCAPKSSIKEILDKNDDDLPGKESVTQPTTISYPLSTSKVLPIGTSKFLCLTQWRIQKLFWEESYGEHAMG